MPILDVSRHEHQRTFGDEFAPRPPVELRTPALRAADVDRDLVHRVLAEAFADGRLDRQEFDERSEQVSPSARSASCPGVIADLVPLRPAATTPAVLTPDDLQRESRGGLALRPARGRVRACSRCRRSSG